jgi:protein-disulfide isomerase
MKSRFNRPTRKTYSRSSSQESPKPSTSQTNDPADDQLLNQNSSTTHMGSSGFDRPLIYSILLVSVFVLGLVSGFLIWGRSTPVAANTVADSSGSLPTPSQQVTRYPVEEGDNPSIGPADAPITIIEFSDYQCPYCQKWENEVYQRLLDEYPTQVRLVYRDFPLKSIHPEAAPAANAANCAGEQDAYFPYHNKLFSYEMDLGRDAYLQYARELNLNMTTFTACLDSEKYAAEVQSDLDYAVNLGVQSTPTFFINGLYLVGAQPYDVFKKLIDQELAGEIP